MQITSQLQQLTATHDVFRRADDAGGRTKHAEQPCVVVTRPILTIDQIRPLVVGSSLSRSIFDSLKRDRSNVGDCHCGYCSWVRRRATCIDAVDNKLTRLHTLLATGF